MPIASSLVLITLLAMPSSINGNVLESPPLSANCISDAGPEPMRAPPRWHGLLPTVVIGFDYQPRQDGRFDFDGKMSVTEATGITAGGATHQLDDRQMSRWTVSLRWRDRPAPDTALSPVATPLSSTLCAQFLTLQSHRPGELAEAIDHWVETARLEALLNSTEGEEAARD